MIFGTKFLLFNMEIKKNKKQKYIMKERSFKRNMCRFALILVILALLSNKIYFYEKAFAESIINPNVPDYYIATIYNSKFILFCNFETGSIIIENRDTEYLWKTTVDNPVDYELGDLSPYWGNYISSMLVINYTDLQKNDGTTKKAFSTKDARITDSEVKNDTISFNYEFSELGIFLSLEISLKEDGIVITIPSSEIEEKGKFGIVSIEIAPFFGAQGDNANGYIFYPDGCGAIMRHDSAKERPKLMDVYNELIFSPENINISEYSSNITEQDKRSPKLPIYGIKNDRNAFLAIVVKNAEEASINVYPCGYAIDLNRAGFELHYRHSYDVFLSNITVRGSNTAKNVESKRYTKDPVLNDFEVKFIFLSENNANYSGMANAYREYLIKNNKLIKSAEYKENIPMVINLFMGIKEERIIFDKYIPMTTFEQGIMIIEQLKNKGIGELQVNLVGWTRDGYGIYPENWPPNFKLGGSSGLKKLLEYTAGNNIKVFLRTNSIEAVTDSRNFSKRKDVIMQVNGIPVTNSKGDSFILNPSASSKYIKGYISKIFMFEKTGLALEKVGEMLYADYNKKNPSSRSQTLKAQEDIFILASEHEMPIGADGGNEYVLKYADHLFNIPVGSSNYHFTDETIPFFQMVIHGIVPYFSEPGNLAYNLAQQKLQWIEYGCMPLFELTYENTVKLKHTKYNKLFNSQYESWIDTIADIYTEFNERLKETWNAQIIQHEKINDDLVKVVYSNGIIIYINYGDNEQHCEGYRIKAQDYIVINREGGIN